MRSVITWTFDRLRRSSRDTFASAGSFGRSGPRTSHSSSWAGELHGRQTGRERAALTLDPSTLPLPAAFLTQRPAWWGAAPRMKEKLWLCWGAAGRPDGFSAPTMGRQSPG